MKVGQMKVVQMKVVQMKVVQMKVGQMKVGQMIVDQMTVGQMNVRQFQTSGSKSKKIFTNSFAETIYNSIIKVIKLTGYIPSLIENDFSRMWFFINNNKKLIIISVKISLNNVKSTDTKITKINNPSELVSALNSEIYNDIELNLTKSKLE